MQGYYGKTLRERPGKITLLLFSSLGSHFFLFPFSSSQLACFFISTLCSFSLSIFTFILSLVFIAVLFLLKKTPNCISFRPQENWIRS